MNWGHILGQVLGSAAGAICGCLLLIYILEGWNGLKAFIRFILGR